MALPGLLGKQAPADADYYLCGPHAFHAGPARGLLEAGVPAGRVHRAVFGPDLLDDIL